MTTRIVTAIGTLAVIAATASVASANPLLSGYGGPGQGSQVVLGGTLLGGGGGGSSGEAPSATPLAPTGTGSSAQTHPGSGPSASTGASARPRKVPGKAGTGVASGPAASLPAGYPGASAGQPPLGISGQDVLYALLVLALLGVTGALTRELARGPDAHVR